MIKIPVVDLFAGPGGLGEGFAAYNGEICFDIVLSIDKDPVACQTLQLRHFFRLFERAPDEYYAYLKGDGITRKELFEAFPREARLAAGAVWQAELGKEPMENIRCRIRKLIGNSPYWVLLGGPPCQAYSFAGRSRMKGMEGFNDDERHTLYKEYLKIVAVLKPTVFVMENVKGILSSRYQDERIFARILSDMRNPHAALQDSGCTNGTDLSSPLRYRLYSFSKQALFADSLSPGDYVIEAEHYCIPQTRHRVIILGIREDYNVIPPVLEKAGISFTVRDVLYGLPKIRSRLSVKDSDRFSWVHIIKEGIKLSYEDIPPDIASRITEIVSKLPESLDTGGRFVPGGEPPPN